MTGIFESLCFGIIAIFLIYYYYTIKYKFWKKRNVPGPEAIPFFGTIKDVALGKISMTQYYKKIYEAYKHMPLVGIFEYLRPILLVNDLDLIRDVFIVDSAIFSGRGFDFDVKAEPLSNHLLHMSGKEALLFKRKMTPLFSPKKTKSIFPLLLQRLEVFKVWLDSLASQNKQIYCGELTSRITVDFSISYLFDYNINTIGDQENDLLQHIEQSKTSWKNIIKRMIHRVSTRLYHLIGYYLFDNAETTRFFTRFFMDIIEYREKYRIDKEDFIGVLMNLKKNPGDLAKSIEITDEFIVAQSYIFFLGAFETSAVTLSHTLYEICANQSIQDKLREEIQNVYVNNNGQLRLEDINSMSYLEATIKETLRMYPITDAIFRQAASDYTFAKTQVTIPKGQLIVVPIYAIHYNPEIYSNPKVYDPERFLSEEASSIPSMFYAPFGHGARSCVAKHLGLLQVKIILITILRHYKVDMNYVKIDSPSYTVQLPSLQPKGIYIKLTKIY